MLSGDTRPRVIARDFADLRRRAGSLSQKEKGKERVVRVEKDFDEAFSIVNPRIVARVRVTVAKLILWERRKTHEMFHL